MRVAVYGRPIKPESLKEFFLNFTSVLQSKGIEFKVLEGYAGFLKKSYHLDLETCTADDLHKDNFDFLLSLGGDGTILDTLQLVGNSELPVLGINLGRLGFLASIKMDEFEQALEALVNSQIVIDRRTVLQFSSEDTSEITFPYALNDVVVQKRDTSAMITVKARMNGEKLNSYWADGLIIATPTGSSGYSMSCGGPLIFPGSNAFVITPIAAHNLTVRPVIIPNSTQLSFEVSGRSDTVLISLDSRSVPVPGSTRFEVKKAEFTFNIVRLLGSSHMETIRNKLMWGLDSRNEP